MLAVTTINGTVDLWNLENITEPILQGSLESSKKGFGLTVDISSDGSLVATGNESGALLIFKTEGNRLIFSIPGHSQPIRSVKFSPTGNLLAVAGDSKLISIYTTNTGEHFANLLGHEGWIFSLAWSETGEFLLSCSYDGKAKIWSLENLSCVYNILENNKPLLSGAWLNKGWGVGVIGGKNKGVVLVGEEKAVRWYREAAGQ